jgi:ATP-dependent DNA helicase RecQ
MPQTGKRHVTKRPSTVCRESESCPQEDDFRDVSVRSDYQAAVARAILLAVAHLCAHSRLAVAPRRVVNFLKGNQFPRPQEREGAWAESFGLLQSHERTWLDEALESLVERGLLELEGGGAGHQGGVRLSPEGNRALHGLEALPGGVLPERPLLGAHPEVEDRLRLARQELAWAEGRATYGIFPNSVLAHLASRKPKTLSELSEIPGLGEARIRKYGRKILAALGEKG